ETLFYLDPPYVGSKKDHSYKKFDFSLEEFLKCVQKIKGKFIISYASDMVSYFKDYYIIKIKVKRRVYWDSEYEILVFNFKPKKNTEWFSEINELDLPEFVWIPDFLSLTGSYLYGNKEPKDIDLVLKLSQGIFDYIYHNNRDLLDALIIKLDRIFNEGKTESPDKKRIHLVPSTIGSNWNNLPIYDLVLRPKDYLEEVEVYEPEFKEKGLNYFQELRGASEEIQNEAELSKKEDKIVFGRFFFPQKTHLPAVMVYRMHYDLSQIEKFIESKPKPLIVQKKYDGNRIILFLNKKDNFVKIVSEDGRVIPKEKFSLSLKDLMDLNFENCILDSECERWLNGKHLNREDVSGFLKRKEIEPDKGIIFNIFDILYYNGKDIHNLPYVERLHYLFNLGIQQSTIGIPKEDYHLNLAPCYIVNNIDDYLVNAELVINSPASEGIMLKSNEKYYLTGYSDTMLKIKKYESVKAKVLKINQTKIPTVINAVIGLRMRNENNFADEFKINYEGKLYTIIGKTFNIRKDRVNLGEIVSVYMHNLNLYKNRDGKLYLVLYEPIISEVHPEEIEPDYAEEVIERAKSSGLLVEKFASCIEDLSTYDPKEMDKETLLDDYRNLIDLIGKTEKFEKDLIKKKLTEIIKEIKNKNIATLHPLRYDDESKDIVIDILKQIDLKDISYPIPEIIKNGILISRIKLNDGFYKISRDGKVYGIIEVKNEDK
ncbi:MAG: hypothetical protein ACK4F0_08465, partial [Candidatus Ratteibacteria bacterium]